MSVEAQELCMRRDYFQIISGEGMGMGDMLFILLEKQTLIVYVTGQYIGRGGISCYISEEAMRL